ncbi:hypothetical protein [Olleya sp. Bg11-27]|uniref:hypothetical protein n=1 Tax=Olleya sp. Bg11-27 TaxID=2058135 RepID=UPI000C304B65|nr:hypothetical protein [Olleya sp. Bg11-27]AUC76390.1 hypothetical protein CW732_12230 [Olleya sp. Bg11-27]
MLLNLQKNIDYTISKDFDITFNENGKLIYTQPKDNENMLIFTENNYYDNLNFYLYQPKDTIQLKIIR